MSLFMAGTIACVSLLAGLLLAMSEQVRVQLRRRKSARVAQPQTPAKPAVASAAESRAAAYREILDALGDDLDDDIAEWEAVLEDFPQVIGAEELRTSDDRASEPMVETAHETTAAASLPVRETITPLHRTRRVSADERDMIQRLMRTGFAPEEIALWLNLPLERVQEFLPRD